MILRRAEPRDPFGASGIERGELLFRSSVAWQSQLRRRERARISPALAEPETGFVLDRRDSVIVAMLTMLSILERPGRRFQFTRVATAASKNAFPQLAQRGAHAEAHPRGQPSAVPSARRRRSFQPNADLNRCGRPSSADAQLNSRSTREPRSAEDLLDLRAGAEQFLQLCGGRLPIDDLAFVAELMWKRAKVVDPDFSHYILLQKEMNALQGSDFVLHLDAARQLGS
jgi:hypothetical protein